MASKNAIIIFRKLGLDLVLIAALSLCIYLLDTVAHQFKRGFFCGDESLMYPYKDNTVSTPLLRIYGIVLPISAFLLCEWVLFKNDDERHKVFFFSIPSWLKAVYYPLASFSFGAYYVELATYVAKHVIGRPRPHFFDVQMLVNFLKMEGHFLMNPLLKKKLQRIWPWQSPDSVTRDIDFIKLCKPSIDCTLPEWQHRYIEHHEYTCTSDQVERFPELFMSFLSGHATWSAYTMIYLALYLEKRVVWSGTRALRHTLQFAVVMVSWHTSLSRISDFKHHWSDVLLGYILGMIFAVIVWQWGTDIMEPKFKNKPVPQKELTSVHTIQKAQSA